jgi:hypothetical protein
VAPDREPKLDYLVDAIVLATGARHSWGGTSRALRVW